MVGRWPPSSEEWAVTTNLYRLRPYGEHPHVGTTGELANPFPTSCGISRDIRWCPICRRRDGFEPFSFWLFSHLRADRPHGQLYQAERPLARSDLVPVYRAGKGPLGQGTDIRCRVYSHTNDHPPPTGSSRVSRAGPRGELPSSTRLSSTVI